MTTLAALVRERWGISLDGLTGLHAEQGWSFEESLDGACPTCKGQLHLSGKPYTSAGRTYRYAALVCPPCGHVLSLDDLGVKSRKALYSRLARSGDRRDARSSVVLPKLSPHRPAPLPDGLVITRAWSLPDPRRASSAVKGVLDEMVQRGAVEVGSIGQSILGGQAGQVERIFVDHQGTTWGCVSSEVRLVSASGGSHGLHVVARECRRHPPRADETADFYSFAAAAASVSKVKSMGVDPFHLGHTTTSSVQRLVEMLGDPARNVPIVLLSGQALAHEAVALSARATGAALVATIDGDASWELSRLLGRNLGCYAGAVRAYPPFGGGVVPDCPVWVSRRVAHEGWAAVAEQIIATVASIGRVSTRVPLEAELEREATADALREASEQIEELTRDLAKQTRTTPDREESARDDDIDAIFDLQNEQIEALTKDLEDVQLRNLELEDKLAAAEQTNHSLRLTLKHRRWDVVDEAASVAIIDETVEAAIERLGDPDGALVCTENALRSWRDASYPVPDRMLDALRRLERAAQEWRDADARIGGRLKEWIHNQVGLRFAGSDHGLERAGLQSFDFEGEVWTRIPHIKIDDAKHSDQVGRIYFAIDSARRRWIVDHVGQKLYGR